MTMFETQIFPLLTIAYLLNSGIYDLLVDLVEQHLIHKVVLKDKGMSDASTRGTLSPEIRSV